MTQKHPQGFTLIEISLVLLIIGLLIGGVLKGQEMIENAKVKRVMSDQEEVRAILYAFKDRYGALPGDFDQANDTFGLEGSNGDGNYVISGDWFGSSGEASQLWLHLRAAGFVSGNTTTATQPSNSYDGIIGVQTSERGSADGTAAQSVMGLQGQSICLDNIPKDVVMGIVNKHDNGRTQDGLIRASSTQEGEAQPFSALNNARVVVCFGE